MTTLIINHLLQRAGLGVLAGLMLAGGPSVDRSGSSSVSEGISEPEIAAAAPADSGISSGVVATDPEALSREMLIANGYEPGSINLETTTSAPDSVSDEVVLADGDVIRGRITEETEDEIVLAHPVFQELRIPRDRIIAIRREAPLRRGSGFGEVVTGAGVRPPGNVGQGGISRPVTQTTGDGGAKDDDPEKDVEAEPEDLGGTIESLAMEENWTFVLGTAFGYVQNVNTELNVRLSAQAEHVSEFARLRMDCSYFLNSTNDLIVDNDFLFKLRTNSKGTNIWDATKF